MKIWFLSAFAVLGTLVAASAQNSTNQTGNPQIKFDKLVYDFGRTSMVQSVTGTFTFSNTGDGVLEVQKPNTSCGCTVASVKPDKLEKGQKGELVFTLNVAGLSQGKLEKTITVPSNDNQMPTVTLTVKAELFSIYEVAPSLLSFRDLRIGSTMKFTVIVKRTDGQPLNITTAQTSSDAVRVRVEPMVEYANTAARVLLEVTAQGQPGRLAENVALIGGDGKQIAVVPISGRLVGDVAVAPELVFWGINDPENWPGAFPELMTKRPVRVTLTATGQTLEIKNPKTTLSDIELTVVPVEQGKVYEVVARLTAAPKTAAQGTITFETNIPSQPLITVPVTINVLRRQPAGL